MQNNRLKRVEQRFTAEVETHLLAFVDWVSKNTNELAAGAIDKKIAYRIVSDNLALWLADYEKADARSAKVIRKFMESEP